MDYSSILHGIKTVAEAATAACGDGTTDCNTGLQKVELGTGQLHQILAIVFGTFGALAVLMIVISGLRFITAQGEPAEIAKARKTIIYAVAGLAIAVSAEVIIAFVLGKV